MVPESYYVALSAILFCMGVLGVLIRRDPLATAAAEQLAQAPLVAVVRALRGDR